MRDVSLSEFRPSRQDATTAAHHASRSSCRNTDSTKPSSTSEIVLGDMIGTSEIMGDIVSPVFKKGMPIGIDLRLFWLSEVYNVSSGYGSYSRLRRSPRL
jgi:hypothetical protein